MMFPPGDSAPFLICLRIPDDVMPVESDADSPGALLLLRQRRLNDFDADEMAGVLLLASASKSVYQFPRQNLGRLEDVLHSKHLIQLNHLRRPIPPPNEP